MRIEGKKDTILFLQNGSIKIVKIHGTRENEELIIPFPQIASIQIKKPGAILKGYIQFKTTGIMQRFVYFSGEENYKTALKIQKIISEYKSHPVVAASPPKPENEIHIPSVIGEYELEYKYYDVEVNLCVPKEKSIIGKPLTFSVDDKENDNIDDEESSASVFVSIGGNTVGKILSEKLSDMIIDFLDRNEPVYGVLNYYDEYKTHMFLGFYKIPKYKRLIKRGASYTEVKLQGTNKFRDNLVLCSVGEEVSYSFDYEKEKYLALCGFDIGFFPKSSNKLLEENPSVFINNIEEDEDGNVSVFVSIFD